MSPDLRKTLGVLLLGLVIVVGAIVFLRRAGSGEDAQLVEPGAPASVEERLAALRDKLVELRVAQDTFHRHYGIYGRSVGQMRFAVPEDMRIEIIGYSEQGWAAQASVSGSDRLCAIFVGDSARWAFPPARQPGVPACTP